MPYSGPRDAIRSVLVKLGVEPDTRVDRYDQDPEYTACRPEEIDEYVRVLRSRDVTVPEMSVLCCFLLECLNDRIQDGSPHPHQAEIFDLLLASDVHKHEFAYWMDTSDADAENWCPITKPLLEHAAQQRVAGDGPGATLPGIAAERGSVGQTNRGACDDCR